MAQISLFARFATAQRWGAPACTAPRFVRTRPLAPGVDRQANGGCEGIGDGFVTAARSFVARSIARGNPARIIGRTGDQKAYAEVRQTDVLLGA